MTDKFKWTGWAVALLLLATVFMQRSCGHRQANNNLLTIHDTISVPGDRQLFTVQDTVLKPYKVYEQTSFGPIDTSKILHDYFAGRVYLDTVRARDITAVIADSISGNKIAGRKVLLENDRVSRLATITIEPQNKVFVGGFVGFSQLANRPAVGISLAFLTKGDRLYHYGFDIISRTHTIGMAWKLNLAGKK